MENGHQRIVLTGFMGVGKTTVARHLSYMVRIENLDLDTFISEKEGVDVAEILKNRGEDAFREIESDYLLQAIEKSAGIISLGGGAWTIEKNRKNISESGITSIWLESTFDHCWRNITHSRFERPLAKDKKRARKLFDERVRFYCLADWHFVIKPGNNSYDVARQIASEVFAK